MSAPPTSSRTPRDAWRDAWRRIGSTAALDPRTFPVFAVGVLAANLISSGATSAGRPLPVLAAGALSLAPAFGVLLVARALLFRSAGTEPRSRPLGVLAAFALALLLRAWVFDSALLLLGTTQEQAALSRFLISLPGMGGGLILAAYTVSLARDYVRHLAEHRALVAASAELATSIEDRARDDRARVAALVHDRVDGALHALAADTPEAARERLADAVDGLVRPLSRELGDHRVPLDSLSAVPAPQLRASDVLRNAVAGDPLRPFALAITVGVTSFAFAVALWGLVAGAAYTAAVAALSFGMTWVGRAVWRRTVRGAGPVPRAVWFTAILLVGGGIVDLLLAMIPGIAPASAPLVPDVVLGVLYGWAAAILASLAREGRRAEAAVAEARRTHRAQVAHVTGILRAQHRAIGLVLHGPVQSSLHAASVRLSAAIRDGRADAEAVADAQARVTAALGLLDEAEPQAPPLETTLRAISDLWRGVTEVSWSITTGAERLLAGDPVARAGVTEIVREACANAIRHADAAVVSVRVEDLGGELHIRVANTADHPGPEGRPGYGTVLLDELASAWTRTWADGVTEVRATVPATRSTPDAEPGPQPRAASAA